MKRIEITVSEEDHAMMQAAADAVRLKLATWIRAQVVLAAMQARK